MRWLRAGLYALAGTVAIVLSAVAVLISIDLGMFKDRIEVLATDLFGRELRIDGELHVRIGTSFELFAEDVYLANPEWADDEAFVTARKIDIAVKTWSLVKGPIDIERLEIDGVRVNLEENAEGDASWIFEGLETEPDSESADGRWALVLRSRFAKTQPRLRTDAGYRVGCILLVQCHAGQLPKTLQSRIPIPNLLQFLQND